jgi:hypothetical protein
MAALFFREWIDSQRMEADQGGGKRRGEDMSASSSSVLILGHASAYLLIDRQRGPFDVLCLRCD